MKMIGMLCGLIACTGAAAAETVEFALPDLAGAYESGLAPPDDAPRLRTVDFTFPASLVSLDGLEVAMSGTSSFGRVVCEYQVGGQTVRDTLDAPAQMRLVLTAETLGGGCFFGAVTPLTPEFDGAVGPIEDCALGDPLDPDLLLGTTIHAELECRLTSPCGAWLDAHVEPTDIRLRVDGQLVAAEATSWGGIKTRYR